MSFHEYATKEGEIMRNTIKSDVADVCLEDIEDVVERIVERVVPYAAMMLVGVVLGYAWRMIQG